MVEGIDKPWELLTKEAEYRVGGAEEIALRAHGFPVRFPAVSIGRVRGAQIAIIPLDESSIGIAEHIVEIHNKWLEDKDTNRAALHAELEAEVREFFRVDGHELITCHSPPIEEILRELDALDRERGDNER